jgi:hypothetical protein
MAQGIVRHIVQPNIFGKREQQKHLQTDTGVEALNVFESLVKFIRRGKGSVKSSMAEKVDVFPAVVIVIIFLMIFLVCV